MILLKNAEVYTPEYIGDKDILIEGEKILKIDNKILDNEIYETLDCSDKIVIPGFIDNHIHIIGGGGEGGFFTRAPEIKLVDLISNGITTVIGLLGTDNETRSIENLVAKTYSLRQQGLSAYCLTGSYSYPSITLTGSIKKDITFVDPIIGTKIALNDHRSSEITINELARIASDTRIAGMISNKSGIVIAHMGSGKFNLSLLIDLINETNIPITTIHPTHINRKKDLLYEAFDYAKKGGYIDLSAGYVDEDDERSVTQSLKDAIELNIPLDKITISSDAQGSWSNYDEDGNLTEIGILSADLLFNEFKTLVKADFLDKESILKFFTKNVAKSFKLKSKGQIAKDFDADLLVLDKDFNIEDVIARGKFMIKDSTILKRGTFE